MPSSLISAQRGVGRPTFRTISRIARFALAASGLTLCAALVGCAPGPGSSLGAYPTPHVYPPAPQPPRVVALGNLRTGAAPSRSTVQLSLLLFGAEPRPPLTLIKPSALASSPGRVLIADSALGGLFRWDADTEGLSEASLSNRPANPVAADIAANGDWLVADAGSGTVLRYDSTGAVVRRYTLPDAGLRPAGVAAVGEEIWISNLAAHRIEVFDAESGRHLRSIGSRGRGPGRFGLPLGLARTPGGDVCVVDMLNHRVQVLDTSGRWLRDIGEPGDRVGSFGRPKDVAVGPDGTIFVTDTTSQRVHAFDRDGRPLLAFGQPDSGAGALALPGAITLSESGGADASFPDGFSPAYYVLIAEQLRDPGVRVYAWGAGVGAAIQADSAASAAAENPHWNAQRCSACHTMDAGRAQPIAAEAIDDLCVSCHDGEKAPAETHPVSRPATGRLLQLPEGWPTVNDSIGCATCHDIRSHCGGDAQRPSINPLFLREYDEQRPMDFCNRCHVSGDEGRVSAHRQLDDSGGIVAATCQFCHSETPAVPPDGRRRFDPKLRIESSSLCLTCHVRHWDVSERGHIDRPVTDDILRRLLEGSAAGGASGERSERLPLAGGRVACYTCHNPHEKGLFPTGSPLATRAESAADAAVFLRSDRMKLCLECHAK